jgi:Protein of unknown function (DUF2846)
MKHKSGSWLLIVASVVGLSLTSGCATTGPAFAKVENIPADKGLIYIYRPSSFKGAAVKYTVHVKDKATMRLTNGGYFPYFADLGENEVWAKTEAKSSVTLDVKPGQTYYVKGGVRMGFAVGRPDLSLQPADIGAAEVSECKLITADKE